MTRKRNDSHSTEFGLWLREQRQIDSKLGYVATNLDYVWHNYRSGLWQFIEEKRHGSTVPFAQRKMFEIVNRCSKTDPNYRGFYLVTFEHTSPEDGDIFINNEPASVDDLMALLQFEQQGTDDGKL